MIKLKSKICRRCLKQKLGNEFEPKEFIYDYYPRLCPSCRKLGHLVVTIPLKAYIRTLF